MAETRVEQPGLPTAEVFDAERWQTIAHERFVATEEELEWARPVSTAVPSQQPQAAPPPSRYPRGLSKDQVKRRVRDELERLREQGDYRNPLSMPAAMWGEDASAYDIRY